MKKQTYYNVFCRFRCNIGDGEIGGVHTRKTEAEAKAEVENMQRRGFGKEEKDQRIEVWKITKERIV